MQLGHKVPISSGQGHSAGPGQSDLGAQATFVHQCGVRKGCVEGGSLTSSCSPQTGERLTCDDSLLATGFLPCL